MSQPQSESYTAAKGGISALTHALAVSFAGKVRVNSISPGWIDTAYTVYQGPDAIQQPAGRVGNPLDIANMVLFLASSKAGFITGENICIDGGQTPQTSRSATATATVSAPARPPSTRKTPHGKPHSNTPGTPTGKTGSHSRTVFTLNTL